MENIEEIKKDKIKKDNIKKDNIKKDNIKKYYKNKYKNDIVIKKYWNKRIESKINQIFDNIVKRTHVALILQNITKTYTYIELLGSSLQDFEIYLTSKFKEGMSLDNYGEWEIDHIKPISSFNLNNKLELFECCNYNNLQPLWKKENRIKSNKYNINSD